MVNDFVIPNKNEQTAEQHRGRHFQIFYEVDQGVYLIKDLGVGYGVFVRQEHPIQLKDNMLINVGEAYIVVNIIYGCLIQQDQDLQQHFKDAYSRQGAHQQLHLPEDLDVHADDNTYKLKLKIFGGPSAGEIYYYKEDFDGQTIVIGRTPECNIRINDKLLSKSQASVSFSPEQSSWILTDGLNGKPSTNGTWLYLNENFEMHPGMIFKANQTIFHVDLSSAQMTSRHEQ